MSIRHRQLHAGRWARTRRRVFKRDGYRCRRCGRAGRLEADHVDPDWGTDPYDLANLQTLCRTCHISKTAEENRREPSPEQLDWRRMLEEMIG